MIVAQHYMHQAQNEKARVYKKQGHGATCGSKIDKASQIPHTNVIPPTFERDDGYDVLEGAKSTPS